jgi:hypothetical protein
MFGCVKYDRKKASSQASLLMHLIAFRQPGTPHADIPRVPDVEEWCDEQRCVGIGTLPSLVRKHLPCLGGHHKDQPRTWNTTGARPSSLQSNQTCRAWGLLYQTKKSRSFREDMRRLECRAQHRFRDRESASARAVRIYWPEHLPE